MLTKVPSLASARGPLNVQTNSLEKHNSKGKNSDAE
jgi:hypothetical protein